MWVQEVQAAFEQAQASYDPNNIVNLLQHHPYHVDSLLAMYDVYRSSGSHETAEDMLQRAVYALEMAWHSRYNPINVDVFISYDRPVNRPLFRALFLHAQVFAPNGFSDIASGTVSDLLQDSWYQPFVALCPIHVSEVMH